MDPLEESDAARLALSLGISPRMGQLLVELYNRAIFTHDEVDASGISQSHRVLVARMARQVRDRGIEIETKHGTGYWIGNASRSAIRNALTEVRSLTPEGN